MKSTYASPKLTIKIIEGEHPITLSGVHSTIFDIGWGGIDNDGSKTPSARHRNNLWDDEDEEP